MRRAAPPGPCARGAMSPPQDQHPRGHWAGSWASGRHEAPWEWDGGTSPAGDSGSQGPAGACWGWEGAESSPLPDTAVAPPGGSRVPGDLRSCGPAQGHCGCCRWRARAGLVERDTCWPVARPSPPCAPAGQQRDEAAADSAGRGAQACPCQAAAPCGLGAPSRSADSLDSCAFSTATSSLSAPRLWEGRGAPASAPGSGGPAEETLSSMLGCCTISPGAAALPLGIDRSPTANSTAAHLLEEFLAQKARAQEPAALPADTEAGGSLHTAGRPRQPCASSSSSLQQLRHHRHGFQLARARFERGPEACSQQREPRPGWEAGATWRCSHSGDGGRAEPHLPPRSAARDSGVCAARGPPCRATGWAMGHGCCATVEVVGRWPREDPGRAWGPAFPCGCREPCGVCPPPAWGPQNSIQGARAAGGAHEEAAGARDWIKECPTDLPATPAPCHAARRVRSSHSAMCFHAHATGPWTSASCSDHAPGSPCPAPSRTATRPRHEDYGAPRCPGRSCPWDPAPTRTPQPIPRSRSCSDTDPSESPEGACACTYCPNRGQRLGARGQSRRDAERGWEWDRGTGQAQGWAREQGRVRRGAWGGAHRLVPPNMVWLIAEAFERRARREAARAERERRAQERRGLGARDRPAGEAQAPRGWSQQPKRGNAQAKDPPAQAPRSQAATKGRPLGPPHPRREARAPRGYGHLSAWL